MPRKKPVPTPAFMDRVIRGHLARLAQPGNEAKPFVPKAAS
jgi:hypothetical protein